MHILGLDLSLTSTGYAIVETGAGSVVAGRLQPGKRRDHERMEWLYQAVREQARGCSLAVVEGPSFASSHKQHEMGGMWWLVTYMLWHNNYKIVVVPPSSLKKYLTGNGNAGKDLVLSSVIRRFPQAAEITGNDEADALGLAAMGADALGFPLAQLPVTQRAVLEKWPFKEL